MVDKKVRAQVEKATVTLLKKGGRGILVKNNFILTAAHCIEFTTSGEMAGENIYFIEEIETVRGNLQVTPYAVEPVSDIAVLGSMDDQLFFNEAIAFEEFCDTTKAIPLWLQPFSNGENFPVYIYTHKKTWIKGGAELCNAKQYQNRIYVNTEHELENGTSGSPIINEQGQLVALVSNCGTDKSINNKYDGTHPLVHMALPRWVLKSISPSRVSD